MTDTVFDTAFKHPFAMIVAGASGTGKTEYVKRLLDPGHISPPLVKTFWFYSEWQPAYTKFPPNVTPVAGMPASFDDYIDGREARCLVFDDLMSQCADNGIVKELFLQKRHHANVSVILILQNLFCQGKQMRNIHLNTQYVVLFPTPRDKSQFDHFARQVEPRRRNFLMDAYKDATARPYSHLLVDLMPHTPEKVRYRSESLSNQRQTVYIPK